MAQCDLCGQNENMPYQCRMCGGTFCAEHRLPENHSCPGLNQWNDPEGVFDSGFDDSANSNGGRLSAATRTGGPLSYFRGNMTFVFLGLMVLTFVAEIIILNVMGDGALFDKLFLLQTDHIARVWTWVTSIFAHNPYSFTHILFNGIVLYFFGTVLERRIGSGKFAALFLVSGILAGLAQVGIVGLTTGANSAVLGASGAIMAVMGTLTVLNPNMKIYIYFILPLPLWVATIAFALYSAFVSVAAGPGAGNVAQLAHLTGLGIGLLYGAWVKKQGGRGPSELDIGGGGRGGMGGGRRRF